MIFQTFDLVSLNSSFSFCESSISSLSFLSFFDFFCTLISLGQVGGCYPHMSSKNLIYHPSVLIPKVSSLLYVIIYPVILYTVNPNEFSHYLKLSSNVLKMPIELRLIHSINLSYLGFGEDFLFFFLIFLPSFLIFLVFSALIFLFRFSLFMPRWLSAKCCF